jgi:hypothetical protein
MTQSEWLLEAKTAAAVLEAAAAKAIKPAAIVRQLRKESKA